MTKLKFTADFSGQIAQGLGSGSVVPQNPSSDAHQSASSSSQTSRVAPLSQPAKPAKRQRAVQACVPCHKAKRRCEQREDGNGCEGCFLTKVCWYQPVTEEENKRIRAQRKARQERRKVEEASKQRKRKQKKQCKRKQSSVAVPGLESQQPVSASSAPTAAYGSAVRQQGSVTPVGADWPSSDESPYGSDTSLSSADPVTPLNGLSQAPGWPFPSQPAVPAYAVPHQQPFYADQNVPVQPMHQIRTSPEISCNLPYPSSSFINSAYDSTMPQSQPNVDWMAMQASNFDHREQPYQQQLQTSQQQPQYPHQHLQVQQFAFSAPLPNGGYSNDVYPTSAYSNGTHTYGL